MARIILAGGGIAGLGSALLLSRAGHRVTLLERDATPFPPDPISAFESWERRGAPQVRQSHAFLARLRNLLRDRAPDVLASLLEMGAEELPVASFLTDAIDDPSPRPGDEDLVMLACRRMTFEWVLHRTVLDSDAIEYRDGADVRGLVRGPDRDGQPSVIGVRVASPGAADETLLGDFVLDTGGRRSKLPAWLEAIGIERPRQVSEACGIYYCSRFYRLVPGKPEPQRETSIGADLGYLKYGIFHGDSKIFSVTFAAPPEDKPLRALLRTGPFAAAAAALPATRAWVESAEPITDVHGMDGLQNARRFFLKEGEPLALGLAAVGDSAIHTNPLYGRGCSLALVHAALFADALAAHPDDPRATLLDFEAATEREIVPWYDITVTQDRDAIEVAERQRGEAGPATPPPSPEAGAPVDPKAYMRDVFQRGLIPALRTDATVFRAFLRSLNLLDAPGDLLKHPEVLGRVLAVYQQRDQRESPVLGPDRAAMLDILRAAA